MNEEQDWLQCLNHHLELVGFPSFIEYAQGFASITDLSRSHILSQDYPINRGVLFLKHNKGGKVLVEVGTSLDALHFIIRHFEFYLPQLSINPPLILHVLLRDYKEAYELP